MSGGVDSSVSALLLQQQGYEIIGTTLQLINNSEDAQNICNSLQIPYHTYNCKEEFRKCVIQDFIDCYANCKTPNPCIECNKYMKFGYMWECPDIFRLNNEYILIACPQGVKNINKEFQNNHQACYMKLHIDTENKKWNASGVPFLHYNISCNAVVQFCIYSS